MKPFLRRIATVLGAAREEPPPSRGRGALFALIALVAILVLAVVARVVIPPLSPDGARDENLAETVPGMPGEGSAEAGFARDMMVHHAQAVQMAEIAHDKTESQDVEILASNILLAQQAEIGQMRGWLQVWGLPPTSAEPAMAWMGHPTEGRMPGMANPEELDELQRASPEEADVLFLQLMIPHHEAALPMAEAVLEETYRPEVEQLATAASSSQHSEIRTMQESLQMRGVPAEVSTAPIEGHSPGEVSHQDSHPEHSHQAQPESRSTQEEVPADARETAAGIARGATQGAAAFLVGLVAFVALVWLPADRNVGLDGYATPTFVRCVWVLFGLLVVASVAELSLYAVRASGEPLGFGLLEQTIFDTRVGHVWLVRVVSGLLVAVAATLAARLQRPAYWWWAAGIGGALLETLTLTSHAATEGLLPSLADWLHVVSVSVWMGGLLGFALVLLGPLRAMPEKQQRKLRWRAVRRFSRIATLAVMSILVTGLYATLLHVPDVEALLGTPYGRALTVKLALAVLLLMAGGVNLALDGRRPFGRMVGVELALAVGVLAATGLLTSLPPAGVVSP